MPDPYLIPGTVVLQNKLGISDFDELEQAVADAMAYRLFDKNTPVPPTLAGWRAVHKARSAQCSSGPAISAMSICLAFLQVADGLQNTTKPNPS
jgi:hypothetical protein